jgi:hypothetical protein
MFVRLDADTHTGASGTSISSAEDDLMYQTQDMSKSGVVDN